MKNTRVICIALLLFASLSACFWVGYLRGQRAVNRAGIPTPDAPGNPSFADVPESAIPGRYKYIELGVNRGVITLFPDHTFAGLEGIKNPVYRWQLYPDGLILVWQKGPLLLSKVVAPGVYLSIKKNSDTIRLEKMR
jgi:hypothetical protein